MAFETRPTKGSDKKRKKPEKAAADKNVSQVDQEINSLKEKINKINKDEQTSAGFKIKDRIKGEEETYDEDSRGITPDRETMVRQAEDRIRELENEKKNIITRNKKKADRLKKEIEALNKQEQQPYKTENFKIKDKRSGSVEPDREKMVLEREAEIRKLEDQMMGKMRSEKELRVKEASENEARKKEMQELKKEKERLQRELERTIEALKKRTEENKGFKQKLQGIFGIHPDLGEADGEKVLLEKTAQDLGGQQKAIEDEIGKKQQAVDAFERKALSFNQEEWDARAKEIREKARLKAEANLRAKNEAHRKEIFQDGSLDAEPFVGTEDFEYRKDSDQAVAVKDKEIKPFGGTGNFSEEEWQDRVKKVLAGEDPDNEFHAMVPVSDAKSTPRQEAKPENKAVVVAEEVPASKKEVEPKVGKAEAGVPMVIDTKKGDVSAETKKFQRRADIVSVDEIVKAAAWRQAEEKVRQLLHAPEENMQSGGRFKSVLNNIWAGIKRPDKLLKKSWVRMGEDGYRKKFYFDALKQMTDNQNLMVQLESSWRLKKPMELVGGAAGKDTKRSESEQILAKVLEEYNNEVVEQEEKGNQITDPRVNDQFQKLFYAYQRSVFDGREWDKTKFEKVQRRMINGLKKNGLITDDDFLGAGASVPGGQRSKSDVKGGHMYASNIYDIAKDYQEHIKGSIDGIADGKKLTKEQKEKLKSHVSSTLELDLNLGSKMADVMNKRPKGTLTKWEDRISRMQAKGGILGRIAANPGALAVPAAIAGSFFSKGAVKLGATIGFASAGIVTGAWIPVAAAGATAGVFGFIRRTKELKHDRAMHQRQKTLGKEYTDFRRTNLDNFQYDVKSTTDLNNDMDAITATSTDGTYNGLDPAAQKELASMFSRYKFELMMEREHRRGNSNRTVDLISAADEKEGEKYGTHYLSKTDLKIKLYKYLKDNNLIDKNGEPQNDEFKTMTIDENLRFLKNIKDTDKAFNEHAARSALFAGAISGLTGALGAYAAQEATSAVMEHFGYGPRVTAHDTLFHREKISGMPYGIDPNSSAALAGLKMRPDGTPDPSTVPAGWKLVDHGAGKGMGLVHDVARPDGYAINPQKALPPDVMKALSVKPDGTVEAGALPPGWKMVSDGRGTRLIHEFAKGSGGKPAGSWNEFVKGHGLQNDQRVSYQGFKYQGTAPDKGVRAMVENAKNLAHNLRLHSNSTELMMKFKDGGDGSVIVDASKMFGKELKASLVQQGIKMDDYLAKGGKFYMSMAMDNNPSAGGSQFHPILLEMGKDGKIIVPKELAHNFFKFKNGKLVQGPGYGLKQLVMDTGMKRPKDGAMIVEGISARLGQKPSLNIPVDQVEEIPINVTPKTIIVPEEIPIKPGEPGTPWDFVPTPAAASRWQLEDDRAQRAEKERLRKEKKDKKDEGKDAPVGGFSDVPLGEDRQVEDQREDKTSGYGSGGEEKKKSRGERLSEKVDKIREKVMGAKKKKEEEAKAESEGKKKDKEKKEKAGSGSGGQKAEGSENKDDNDKEAPGAEAHVSNSKGAEILSKHKDAFDNIDAVLGRKYNDPGERAYLLSALTDIRKEDSKGQYSRVNEARRAEIRDIYDRFNKKNPGLGLTLAEFKAALWKRLVRKDVEKQNGEVDAKEKRSAETQSRSGRRVGKTEKERGEQSKEKKAA